MRRRQWAGTSIISRPRALPADQNSPGNAGSLAPSAQRTRTAREIDENGLSLPPETGSTAGNSVWVRTRINGTDYTMQYMRMAEAPRQNVGQTISRGSTIGPIGTTGLSTGVHSHFGVFTTDEPTGVPEQCWRRRGAVYCMDPGYFLTRIATEADGD